MISFRLNQFYRILRYQGLAGLLYRLRCRLGLVKASHSEDPPLCPSVSPVVEIKKNVSAPPFSVVMPVFKPERRFLEQAVESVLSQDYPNLELCISDDASDQSWLKEYLAELQKDSRVKIHHRSSRGHIALNSNSALELATGDFVILLDQDDLLVPGALQRVAAFLLDNPDCDLCYSDEEKIDEDGRVIERTEKPDWSPLYFQRYMYVGHLKCVRRSLLEKLNGFREGTEGSQDYDLVLRVWSERGRFGAGAGAGAGAGGRGGDLGLIGHIPEVLYRWRAHAGSVAGERRSKGYAYRSALLALYHFFARDKGVEVEQGIYPGVYRPIRPLHPVDDRVLVLLWGKGQVADAVYQKYLKPFPSFVVEDLGEDPAQLQANLLSTLSQYESECVVILNRSIIPFAQKAVHRLVEEVGVGEVAAATGLIANRVTGEVMGAGYQICDGRATAQFAGLHRFDVGPGMRLATGCDVDLIGVECMAVRTRDLLKVLKDLEQTISVESLSFALSMELAKRGGLLFTPYSQFFLSHDRRDLSTES